MPDERRSTTVSELGFSSGERSETGGRCPPDPLGFIALGLLPTRRSQKGGPLPTRLTQTLSVTSLQIGAQVASLRCPILRWSTQSLSATKPATRGPKSNSGFDRTSGFAHYKVSGFANYTVRFC